MGFQARGQTFADERQLFGAVRGEVDLPGDVTAWAAFGGRVGEEANVLANPTATPEGLTTAFRFDNAREDRVLSADAGLRAGFEAGGLGHRVVASVTAVDLRSKNAFALSNFLEPLPGSLYAADDAPLPRADFFAGGVLGDPLTTEETTNVSYALADTVSALGGMVRVTGGVRYQEIETRAFDFTSGARTSSYASDAWTPAVGVVISPGASVAVFANYAESLRPGQVAPASVGSVVVENAGEVLDPFRGTQVEAGVKYDGGAFGATASVFTLDQQNAVVTDGVFAADGAQRSRGIEAVAYGAPLPWLRIVGGATYLDAEFTATQGGLGDGDPVIGVPDFQANLNVEADVPGAAGLTADGRVLYTGSQPINADGTEEIAAWTRLDLGLRYVTSAFGPSLALAARAENVLDAGYWASAGGFPGANYLVQGDPRTVLVSLSAEF